MISESKDARVLWNSPSVRNRRIKFGFPLAQRHSKNRKRRRHGTDIWLHLHHHDLWYANRHFQVIHQLLLFSSPQLTNSVQQTVQPCSKKRLKYRGLHCSGGHQTFLCFDIEWLGRHKLIFTFLDKNSRLNYPRKPLCWQRWNPGRGNICQEISV